MRLLPKRLAGRLAALLILTLIVAQMVTFALFSGERIAAFRSAYREDVFARLASLVGLLEETPASLHERILTATSSAGFAVSIDPDSAVEPQDASDNALRARLATAVDKPVDLVRVEIGGPPWREHRQRRWWWRDDDDDDDDRERRRELRRRPPPWARASIELADGRWLNASADRPPVPPLGHAFLASFLISAAAVAAVGALGVRFASGPLRQLAQAADRLGRGESFEPLPESGPEETRHANVAFNRMRERIDRFVRDRTAMLAAIAHDLRTPITTLRLRAEFIEDEETKEKMLETLAEMQAMAEAVLAFTRGDAESEESRTTDVTALVESIVEDAAETGRDVRFEDSAPVTMACRPMALKRAVGNLVDNASFYGTRARVRVERVADEVWIVADDDGPGIPEAELEHVFDPFVRLEGSRSRDTGGAGLGLAIARSIARAHGGDVRLENRAGGGLRAVLSLPG
jgi:signal transduction histidine kinase